MADSLVTQEIVNNYRKFAAMSRQSEQYQQVTQPKVTTGQKCKHRERGKHKDGTTKRSKVKKVKKITPTVKLNKNKSPGQKSTDCYIYKSIEMVRAVENEALLHNMTASATRMGSDELRHKAENLAEKVKLSDITENLLGSSSDDLEPLQLVADIQPKHLIFTVDDPNKQSCERLYITNNSDAMEIFTIKSTNPYLFRVQPFIGYMFPRETIEVQIQLLEGVNVRNDRFLVLVAQVPNDMQVDKLTNSEISRLWKSKDVTQWDLVYQEKIQCSVTGNYRQKSKILSSAFEPKIYPAEQSGENSKIQGKVSVPMTHTLAEVHTDKDMDCQAQTSQSCDLSSLSRNTTSTALVPYRETLNTNCNSNLSDWLRNVPTEQIELVESVYAELMEVKHRASTMHVRMNQITYKYDSFPGQLQIATVQQSRLGNELDKVRRYVQELITRAADFKHPLSAKDLRTTIMSHINSLNSHIESILVQHENVWRKIQEQEQSIEALRQHERPVMSSSKGGHRNVTSNANISSNANASANAKLEHHVIYDERSAGNARMRELEQNQAALGGQMADISANITNMGRRTQTMTEVLKNITKEMKNQKRDMSGDVGKLEMKYLEQCALLPLQELGRQNQDLLGNLYTNFMGHIEKVTNTLDKLMVEHRALSHYLDHQAAEFNKLKRGMAEMGKGIQAEHQHILRENMATGKKFDQLEMQHILTENHMRDIHAALKNLMEKTKIIAQRVNNLEHDFELHKAGMAQKIAAVRKTSMVFLNDKADNNDAVYDNLKDRLEDILNEIRRLKESAAQNESELRNAAANLRQHKDQTMAQMTNLENKTAAQVEHQIQEARRFFDSLKQKIQGLQGTLKGMDSLLIQANEKLKSLYADLDRYKKALTEEMHRLAKEIADAAEQRMKEIAKTHAAMKKQIDDIIGGLSQAQVDAKAISARLTAIENELRKRAGDIAADLKKAIRDANVANALREQKAQAFHTKMVEDMKNLVEEVGELHEDIVLLGGKMDDLENRTKQKLDDMRASLDEVHARIELLTSSILEEFYNKMQKAADRLTEQIRHLNDHLMRHVDSKIEELARRQANSARDQCAEIYLKLEHIDRLSEGVRLQIDKNFWILILLLMLIPMFMYSAYMGRSMRSPVHHVTTWWNSCCGQYLGGLGRRIRDDL